MKIRIQDHSVRFRVTQQEIQTLQKEGTVESCTEIYSKETRQCIGRFVYGIKKHFQDINSYCEINPGSIWLLLNEADCETLNDPGKVGVYLRNEVELANGHTHCFTAILEKDFSAKHKPNPQRIVDHQPAHNDLHLQLYENTKR